MQEVKQSRYFQVHKSEVQSNVLNFQIICRYCKNLLTTRTIIKKHVIVCQKLYAEKCNTKFESQKKYANHIRSCTDRNFVCLTCKKELSRSDSLLNHARLHYPFYYPACLSKFVTEKELQLHIVEEHITV